MDVDTPTLTGCGAAVSVFVTAVLYFAKRFAGAKRRAAQDRSVFTQLYVPVLALCGGSLWMLFFMNPFRSVSLRPTYAVAGVETLANASESMAVGKKFLLGFLCGLCGFTALHASKYGGFGSGGSNVINASFL